MKFRLFPFSRDLRSPELKQRYEAIEQKRADAYVHLYLARNRAAILRGQINAPSLMRRQAE